MTTLIPKPTQLARLDTTIAAGPSPCHSIDVSLVELIGHTVLIDQSRCLPRGTLSTVRISGRSLRRRRNDGLRVGSAVARAMGWT